MIRNISGIYAISFHGTKNEYIGSSRKLKNRISTHLCDLRKGKHHAHRLQRAWDKYGPENVVITVLEECDEYELFEREQHYLDIRKPKYNTTLYAGNPTRDPEVRAKISAKRAGTTCSYERTEAQQRASYQNGKNRKGQVMTPEWREAVSVRFKGKPKSEEHRAKIGAAHKGRPMSETSKQALAKANEHQKIRVRCLSTGEEFPSISEAAKKYGKRPSGLAAHLKWNKPKTFNGMVWERVSPKTDN